MSGARLVNYRSHIAPSSLSSRQLMGVDAGASTKPERSEGSVSVPGLLGVVIGDALKASLLLSRSIASGGRGTHRGPLATMSFFPLPLPALAGFGVDGATATRALGDDGTTTFFRGAG